MSNKIVRIPKLGRLGLVHEKSGQGAATGFMNFNTNLSAQVIRDGQPIKAENVMNRWSRFWGNVKSNDLDIDLGSGLVTNVGVMALANDFAWANPSGSVNTILALANYHTSGTSSTAAAATDIKIGTISTNGGQTAATGVQTFVNAANLQKYQTVATLSYTGSEAVTEWALNTSSTNTATTGSPLTAVSATTATVTGTPYTASSSTVAGEQFHLIATGTTSVWGFIVSNTSSVLSLANNGTTGWYKVADGTAGSTPGSTETFTLYPILWDHKVFSAINVASGDSIQFTYQLTISSGG